MACIFMEVQDSMTDQTGSATSRLFVRCVIDHDDFTATGNGGGEFWPVTFFCQVTPFYRPIAFFVRMCWFIIYHDRSDLAMPSTSTINVLPHYAFCFCFIFYSQLGSTPGLSCYFEVVPFSFRILFVVVFLSCSSINIQT